MKRSILPRARRFCSIHLNLASVCLGLATSALTACGDSTGADTSSEASSATGQEAESHADHSSDSTATSTSSTESTAGDTTESSSVSSEEATGDDDSTTSSDAAGEDDSSSDSESQTDGSDSTGDDGDESSSDESSGSGDESSDESSDDDSSESTDDSTSETTDTGTGDDESTTEDTESTDDAGDGGDDPLEIADMGLHEVAHGMVFEYQPEITGYYDICRKDIGHDDVEVDPETGAIRWDTSKLKFGRGFHIRIKCSSYDESAYASMVVHVDHSGSSRLRVAGRDGISPYVGVAGRSMTAGDTLVFPDGIYPVSVTADESFENAFRSSAPPDGTETQFTTIIAESPGGVHITGAPHDGIPKQKNAFQLSATANVALVGFTISDIRRSSVTTVGAGEHLLLDFIGAAGAGTDLRACANTAEAANGECSKAGMRVNGGTPLFQNCYDWGLNRYGIMTRSTSGSLTRRSFVRLDGHRGDQPYGGFSDYCDTAHLSQDNVVFDSLAISAPHYKNFAGLSAYPATGCENEPATIATDGLLAVNNELSLSLMDQKEGSPHTWNKLVSYDNRGTCTPQGGRCAALLLQADKSTVVRDAYFGKSVPFSPDMVRPAFNDEIQLDTDIVIDNVEGEDDRGTPPRYLPESQLYYNGRSDSFYGEDDAKRATTARRWPIAGEDIIAKYMRTYDEPEALAVGGGTVHVQGDRGATAAGDSMSEYFWAYTDDRVPPLVVRVKAKLGHHRIAWEHLSGRRRDAVLGWKVLCTSDGDRVLAELDKRTLVHETADTSCSEYAVVATYADGDSGYAYRESAPEPSGLLDFEPKSEPMELDQISGNASGITWHPQLEQFLVVVNGAGKIMRYDRDFNYLGTIDTSGNINSDTEGLAYVRGEEVMVVTEVNVAHKVVIDTMTTNINGNFDHSPAFRLLPRPPSNKGLEGVAVQVDGPTGHPRVYACQEGTGMSADAEMKVVYFDLPAVDPTTLQSFDDGLTVIEPFDAEMSFAGIITDCAGLNWDPVHEVLLVLSQESRTLLAVDPDDGDIVDQLQVSGAPQYEGVTYGPGGELVFVSEPNWIHIYERSR